MCHPFSGFSRGGPHKIAEMLAEANVSEVEDEYGFRYVLVTEAGQGIAEMVSRRRGHNESRLKLVHTSPKKGSPEYDTGLHHKDDSWRKCIIGKLFFVVMERDYSRPQTGADSVPIRPQTKILVFEGPLSESDSTRESHYKKLYGGPCTPCFTYGYHYEWQETSVLPASQR